jgi:hypothetical protein
MIDEAEDDDFQMVRTNNGEYVSDEYAVFLSPVQATLSMSLAKSEGLPLEKHVLSDGSAWFFKHELEVVNKKKIINFNIDEYFKRDF